MSEAVGFIGLGNMGTPMAAQIARSGRRLVVSEVDAARRDAFCAEHGATAATTARAVAEQGGVVITILPNSAIVEAVFGGEDGLLAGLRPGTVVLDMTSGAPAVTQRLAGQVNAAGGTLLDAPVSGGVARAVTGDLAIMVGGPDAAIDQVEPLLKTMGSSIARTGPVASAHAMKALNNLVSAGGLLIAAEAMAVGCKFGLDARTMVDVLNNSSGMNNATLRKFIPFILSRRFDSGFSMALMLKDLGIALDLAHDVGAPSPFASACRELWAAAQAMDVGDDHTAVARLPEILAKVEIS